MRKVKAALALGALLFSAAAVYAQSPPAPAPAPPAPVPNAPAQPTPTETPAKPKPDGEAIGRAVVAEFAAGQMDKIFARMESRLTQILPIERLASGWDGLIEQVGPFQSVTSVEKQDAPNSQAVFVTCAFARAAMELDLMVDADSHIVQLRIIPAGMRAGWKPAAYVKAEAFDERQVTVGSAPWTTQGLLSLPKGAGPFPAVVLVHGSGPADEDESIGQNKPFRDIAGGLASRGVAVLRYVKRTRSHGREMMMMPNGYTLNDETVDDARAAVDLLAKTKEIDPKRIYVLGHSLGGYSSPRIAAGDKDIAGLILMAGNTRPLEDLLIEQTRYAAGLNGKVSAEGEKRIQDAERAAKEIRNPELKPGMTVQALGTPFPASYFLDLRDYHPAEAAAALGIPILVLQGDRDYQVRMPDFDGWKKALGKQPTATFKLYPGLNHLFIAGTGPSSPAEYLKPGHVDEAVLKDIAAWIAGQAPPAAAGASKKE